MSSVESTNKLALTYIPLYYIRVEPVLMSSRCDTILLAQFVEITFQNTKDAVKSTSRPWDTLYALQTRSKTEGGAEVVPSKSPLSRRTRGAQFVENRAQISRKANRKYGPKFRATLASLRPGYGVDEQQNTLVAMETEERIRDTRRSPRRTSFSAKRKESFLDFFVAFSTDLGLESASITALTRCEFLPRPEFTW
ncbi:hypothetical protein CPB85DRAFT_1566103 [Mucidula mucida]|nr:hypothetical protein CPB85DRAFT_1566103 [Mucidula mucida]